MRRSAILIASILSLGLTAASEAAFIVAPTAAVAVGSGAQYTSINNVIDGSGLSGASVANGVTVPVLWPTHSVNQPDLWVAVNGTYTVTFTLPAPPTGNTISGFHFWNENEIYGRSANGYTVEYSTDSGANYFPISSSPNPFAAAPGSATYAGEDYTFATALPGLTDRVRFYLVPPYFTDGYVGFSEIRFVAAVPEPTSFALLGGSVALMGLRRRRA